MAATLEWRLTGTGSNSEPNSSLGGEGSDQSVSETAMNNIFDNVTPAEATAGENEYRALDLYNTGDAGATSVVLYVNSLTTNSYTQLFFAVDSFASETIADENTSPDSVSFTAPTSASKLSLPDISAEEACRVWIRRTVTASAPNDSNDQGSFIVEYA